MSPTTVKTFKAVLEPLQSGLGWVVARIPFDVAVAWPERNRLRVKGEIEGVAFRTSLFAYSGGGGHFLLVNRKMQEGAKARVGSKVRIRLEPDMEERPATAPPELAGAMKGDRRLRQWFDGLSPSMRREIGKWVSEPKSAESRVKRAEKMAERLLLAMEGEEEPPPVLRAAFLRQPQARVGWEAMTVVQRRNFLLGIFYSENAEARERRAAKVVEAALRVAAKGERETG
ncbi:MAG: YdeI/OmpD-associated family protein [Terracidiphilus sp.]|nr:YdeI/OmpD-associated family protein [Terracidiphilus sp.]